MPPRQPKSDADGAVTPRKTPVRRKRATQPPPSVVTPGIASICAPHKQAQAKKATTTTRKRKPSTKLRESSTSSPNNSPVHKRPRAQKKVQEKSITDIENNPALDISSITIEDNGQSTEENGATGNVDQGDQIGAGRSYFEAHKGALRTSNLTLADVNIMPPAALQKALENIQDALHQERDNLLKEQHRRFSEYAFMLAAGHALLFYGYGSKKSLLDELARSQNSQYDIIGLNGYHPSLSLRTVLTQISNDILQLPAHPKRSVLDYVDAINNGIGKRKVLLVVHNIDGLPLRSQESQHALAKLSTIENISIIASIDHVNAPLLWDGISYASFRWLWVKADTFVSYETETVFSSKPMLRGGGERRVEGAIALLKSLSTKARGVFRALAEAQTGVENTREDASLKGKSRVSRLTFNQLFEITKERFLASDFATLRTTLTELQTHDLLESRRGADMEEQIWVPLDASQLKVVLKEIAGP